MKESFDEYKKTIEGNLINFSYLYDGDVKNNSIDSCYSEEIINNNISPNVIINCIKKVYDESITNMIDNSIPVIINEPPTNGIESIQQGMIHKNIKDLHSTTFDPLYVFCSPIGKNLFGKIFSYSKNKPFPDYFYSIHKYNSSGYDLYESPLIKDSKDEICIYVTNKSIQSLVYSLQNMSYIIEKDKHTINYKLYDCDFFCYKLIMRDVSKQRDDKINQILDEN